MYVMWGDAGAANWLVSEALAAATSPQVVFEVGLRLGVVLAE